MRRRKVIRLLAAVTGSLGAGQVLPTSALLRVTEAAGAVSENVQEPVGHAVHEMVLPDFLLPLFPLPLVLFPRTILPLHIFEPRYKQMIRDCVKNNWEFGVLLAKKDSHEMTGCSAIVSEVLWSYHDGRMDILVEGRRRFEVSGLDREKLYLRGRAEFFEDSGTELADEAIRRQALELFNRLLKMIQRQDPSVHEEPPSLDEQELSFQMMSRVRAEPTWKQELLELRSERERVVHVVLYLQQMVDYLEKSPEERIPNGTA
jgi:Lon protease-like protein